MTNETKTVRVRIACYTGDDGTWSACGWSEGSMDRRSDRALGGFDSTPDKVLLTWIEATVPLPPEPQRVEGGVKT